MTATNYGELPIEIDTRSGRAKVVRGDVTRTNESDGAKKSSPEPSHISRRRPVANPAPAPFADPDPVIIIVRGAPVAYVRQTQRDRWMQRPCVVRYRAWRDAIRQAAGQRKAADWLPPISVHIRAYLPIPASWSESLKARARGQWHYRKPDGDNLIKAAADALIANDQVVARWIAEKFWDDGQGPRLEIIIGRLSA